MSPEEFGKLVCGASALAMRTANRMKLESSGPVETALAISFLAAALKCQVSANHLKALDVLSSMLLRDAMATAKAENEAETGKGAKA